MTNETKIQTEQKYRPGSKVKTVNQGRLAIRCQNKDAVVDNVYMQPSGKLIYNITFLEPIHFGPSGIGVSERMLMSR